MPSNLTLGGEGLSRLLCTFLVGLLRKENILANNDLPFGLEDGGDALSMP